MQRPVLKGSASPVVKTGSSGSASDRRLSTTSSSFSTTAVSTHSGYFRTWWEDFHCCGEGTPPGIDTTKVTSHINWKTDGTCLIDDVYSLHLWEWERLTGWGLTQKGPYGIRFPSGCQRG
jgi:hypothetical protein